MKLHGKARCSSGPFKLLFLYFAVSFRSSRNQNDENYAANIRLRCNYQAWEYAF